MTLETTRRSLIAGVPAVALAAAIPASAMSAPADRREWDFALARLSAADAEYEAFVRDIYRPALKAEEAFEEAHGFGHLLPNGTWNPGYLEKRKLLWSKHGKADCVPGHIAKRVDALGERIGDVQDEVMQTPAPDLAALRWKLDKVLEIEHETVREGGSTPSWSHGYVKQTLADMARLLPQGP